MTKCVIIVTYEPELNNLKRLTQCAEEAGFIPVLVDNSEKNPVEKHKVSSQSHVISMKGNAGIAAAQNAGVRYAKKLGAHVIGFFDQDSTADETLLKKLEDSLLELGACVAAPLARCATAYSVYVFDLLSVNDSEPKPVSVLTWW